MSQQEIQWLLKEKYAGVENEAFQIDCARLKSGEPLGYVIGYVPFLDCQIWLDSHPLIPRPETEYWTEQAIAKIKQIQSRQSEPVKIIDLCAGSGCIGVAVAKAIPQAIVTFAELDSTHLPTIIKNLTVNLDRTPLIHTSEEPDKLKKQSAQYHLIQSDLLQNISGVFDFILTNPPYINPTAKTVEKSVLQHEPHLALFGGDAGLVIIKNLISSAIPHLNPTAGQLWIEHEPEQVEQIEVLAKKYFANYHTHNDQYSVPRFTVMDVAL